MYVDDSGCWSDGFFFSSRRRHTRSCLVSWARRCVQETDNKSKKRKMKKQSKVVTCTDQMKQTININDQQQMQKLMLSIPEWNSINEIYKWKNLIEQSHGTLEIIEKRPFNKTEFGWRWYKNLTIPALKINILDNQEVLFQKDIIAELRCYKILSNNLAEDVQLKGKLKKPVIDGKCQIKSIKFLETSFQSRVFQSYISSFILFNIYLYLYIKEKHISFTLQFNF
eukprot:TRINITY_DN31084_c0_g1_i1.p1 TRINITY_DN31084_c0_g1~~TRINITY_DN31084_c0_g1_i1.p1  ORF type:complete len:225 (-),score=35.15 TRINITY_DN31084_c0_g1_i1:52-726(-)